MTRSFLLLLACCGLTFAQAREQEIRVVLDKQVVDWNKGDVAAFMEGYQSDDQTTFVGKNVTKGHASVLADYKKRYPTKDNMGALRFEIVDIRMLGDEHASVLGKFFLKRTVAGGGDINGIFTLIFKKNISGWKIILDHTS